MRQFLRLKHCSYHLSICFFLFLIGLSSTAFSQGNDSKGRDFWLMFNTNISTPVITVFITSDVNTSGTVAVPGLGFSANFNVTANTVTPVVIPVATASHVTNVIDNKGVHITALQEVTVYGLNYAPFTTDAYLGLPTDVLGTEYIVLTYSGQNRSQLGVVATENATTVTITPSVTTSGRPAGVPFNIVMNRGQTYELGFATDFSGTVITSNKPIGVTGSNACANIPPNAAYCDHIVEMIPPVTTWGRKFAAVPLKARTNGDTWRFMASENGTIVTINGVAEPAINRGQWREKLITTQSVIESNKPILVAQYSNGSTFSGNPGDPFMMLIPSLEQFLAKYTVTTVSGYVTHYINVVAPSSIVGSLRLDGAIVPASEFTPIGTSGFSGAKLTVTPGTHNLDGSLPFGVFMYGFNQDDSYGYPGGQSFAPIASVSSIVVNPDLANVVVGSEGCLSAIVRDQNGNALEGVRVDFTITGPHASKSGFAFTAANGQAIFCYTGTEEGTDVIRGSVGTLGDNGSLVWTKPVESTVYYSKPTGALHITGSWGINPNGSGAIPPNFGAGKTFILANRFGVYTMTNNFLVGGTLHNPAGSELFLNGFTLSIVTLTGGGKLIGSPTSHLYIRGNAGGSPGDLIFGTGDGGSLRHFSINRTGIDASATIGSPLVIVESLNIERGTLFTNNMLTLKSSATNTARVTPIIGAIMGNVIVERYIPARRAWRMLNAPVGGTQTINQAWQEGVTTASPNPNPNPGYGTHITNTTVANGFDINPGASPSLKWFDVAINNWRPSPNTNATTVGNKPFMLFVRGDRGIRMGGPNVAPTNTVLRANGPLLTGDQNFSVNSTGFTAIPNPFASPIDFKTITKVNVQNNFYVWDPKMGGANGVGAYVNVSYNGSSYDVTPTPVSPESSLIQSGQSFLVRSTGTSGSIVIKESDKSYTNGTNVFEANPVGSTNEPGADIAAIHGLRVNLKLAGTNSSDLLDGVYTSYSSKFSNAIDQMDAIKMENIQENLALVRSGENLMVERRAQIISADTMFLSMSNMVAKAYQLEFSPVNMGATGVTAKVYDSYLQTVTELSNTENTMLSFSINADAASVSSSRFMVILSKVNPGRPEPGAISISTYPNPMVGNSINLKFTNMAKGTYHVEMYNSIGQVVFRKDIQHMGGTAVQVLNLNKRFSRGIYQLQLRGGDVKTVLKVVSDN